MTFFLNYGADFLVIVASLGAMCYCIILSRRLNRLTSFDKGLGGAIAVMSSQVDEMKAALREAKAGSDGAGKQLHELVHQAREISSELEMMIAACHDFAEEAIAAQVTEPDEIVKEQPVLDQDQPPLDTEDVVDLEGGEEAASSPVFGSRRKPDMTETSDAAAPTPLFRHRRSQVG
jgi:hypothetical protein